MIAAMHTNGGFDWGLTDQCGVCYEVLCVDGPTRGESWSELGEWKGCKKGGEVSVVVMVTDSCPCHHPNFSNKRWCCGDRTHLDLSYMAFDYLAPREAGVVDLKIRNVSCKLQGQVTHLKAGDVPEHFKSDTTSRKHAEDAWGKGLVTALVGPDEP